VGRSRLRGDRQTDSSASPRRPA